MSNGTGLTSPSSGNGGSPVAATTTPCGLECIRIIDDRGSPTTIAPRTKSLLEVSNRLTTDELPGDYVTASADRDNFKIDVKDTKAAGNVIASGKVEIEILKPDKSSFSPKRMLNIELHRVGTSDWFRSKYLRLVVDDKDKAAANNQTILADWDPTDHSVEILGQIVRAKYTGSSGKLIEAIAEVGKNRTWIDVAVHVMRKTPGNDATGVVTIALATENMNKWFRRIYAQINMSPRMKQATQYIDPLENLIAISDNTGTDAAGGGVNGISFSIKAIKSGQLDRLYPIGPHIPSAGDSTKMTADAVAELINATPLGARAVQNPPTLEAAITKGSADVLITDPAGGRIVIEGLTFDDAAQTVTVGRVTATNFQGWAVGAPTPLNWVVGSIQQRTVLQGCDTGKDRIDIVVIDTFSGGGSRGQAMMPGTIYAVGKQAIDEITMSAFVRSHSMSSIDNDPNNCAHECGHGLLDAIHVIDDNTQLLTGGGTTSHYNVNASKRISELEVTFDNPASTIIQESRIRSKASSVLSRW